MSEFFFCTGSHKNWESNMRKFTSLTSLILFFCIIAVPPLSKRVPGPRSHLHQVYVVSLNLCTQDGAWDFFHLMVKVKGAKTPCTSHSHKFICSHHLCITSSLLQHVEPFVAMGSTKLNCVSLPNYNITKQTSSAFSITTFAHVYDIEEGRFQEKRRTKNTCSMHFFKVPKEGNQLGSCRLANGTFEQISADPVSTFQPFPVTNRRREGLGGSISQAPPCNFVHSFFFPT